MYRPISVLILALAAPIALYFIIDLYERALLETGVERDLNSALGLVSDTVRDTSVTIASLAFLLSQIEEPSQSVLVELRAAIAPLQQPSFGFVLTEVVTDANRAEFEARLSALYNVTLEIRDPVNPVVNGVVGTTIRSPSRALYNPFIRLSTPFNPDNVSAVLLLDSWAPNFSAAVRNATERAFITGAVADDVLVGPISGQTQIFFTKSMPPDPLTNGTARILVLSLQIQGLIATAFRSLDSNIIASVHDTIIFGDKVPGEISTSGVVDVPNGPSWTITAWTDANYNKLLVVLVPSGAGVLLLVIALVLFFYVKSIDQQKELSHLTQLAVVHNTFSVMMHEIRNLLNVPVYVLSNDIIAVEDRKFALDSIYTIRDATTKFLTYEKLLRAGNTYILKVAPCNLRKHTYDVVYHTASGIEVGLTIDFMWTDECDSMIPYDAGKLQEIITNLLTNAIKHTADCRVVVKVSVAAGYIIVEILNRYNEPLTTDIQSLYTPYFMRDEPHLWVDVVKDKLSRDETINAQIVSLITGHAGNNGNAGHTGNWHTQEIQSQGHINNAAKQIKSTGMGLSIVRLLCKAMEGETDMIVISDPGTTNAGIVHQWAAIKHGDPTQYPIEIETHAQTVVQIPSVIHEVNAPTDGRNRAASDPLPIRGSIGTVYHEACV